MGAFRFSVFVFVGAGWIFLVVFGGLRWLEVDRAGIPPSYAQKEHRVGIRRAVMTAFIVALLLESCVVRDPSQTVIGADYLLGVVGAAAELALPFGLPVYFLARMRYRNRHPPQGQSVKESGQSAAVDRLPPAPGDNDLLE